jgi:hypothetical protein
MTRKFLILTAAMATVAVPSLAATSSAEASAHHRIYRSFGACPFVPRYAPVPWYAPGYRYAMPYRYFDRLGSNLNPDRQMVGIGE